MPLPPALQNKNVQIGIIAVGLLVGLGFLFFQIMGSGQSGPPEGGMAGPYGAPGGMPGYGPPGAPGGPPGGPGGSAYPGPPGGSGSGYPGPGGPGVSGYGSDTAAAGVPVT